MTSSVRTSKAVVSSASLLVSSLIALAGCSSPINREHDQVLQQSMLNAIEREIEQAEAYPQSRTVSSSLDLTKLEIREDHLETIAKEFSPQGYIEQLAAEHPDADSPISHLIGDDLLGQPTKLIGLSLEQSIQSSVGNNLSVEIARFSPAIAQAALTQAEAQFDWLFFAEGTYQDSSIPQAGQGFGGNNGVIRVDSQTVTGSVGVSRQMNTGGTLELRNDIGYNNVDTSFFGTAPVPNPANNADFVVGLTQPLLQGFGRDANMAQIELARNAERTSVSQLKSTLINTAAETERAYWDLVQAYKVLIIRAKLLDRGIEVRDDIKARRVQDARQAQVADAVARVERRRSDLLVARTNLRLASDRLKALINDPALPVGSETLIVPSEDAMSEQLSFSLLDAITAGVQERPEMTRALLNIDDATIRQQLAKNQQLPRLDLTAQARLLGFDDSFGDAYQNTGETRFIDDWLIGARFEQPIGNRAGEAGYRSARLERMQSVVAYRQTAQNIVLEVKNALNAVTTNGALIEQSSLSRVAQGEALRALMVEKELTNNGYSVERLNLELNQQESLASAEIAEASALTNYNKSIVDLYAAMGTILRRNRIDFVVPDANQLAPGESALEYEAPSEEPEPTEAEQDG
ncbi:MAG: TolC family protein [Phycisphaerales bacterium]|nr:TolC family protein [Phycisphaerales bacterium]